MAGGVHASFLHTHPAGTAVRRRAPGPAGVTAGRPLPVPGCEAPAAEASRAGPCSPGPRLCFHAFGRATRERPGTALPRDRPPGSAPRATAHRPRRGGRRPRRSCRVHARRCRRVRTRARFGRSRTSCPSGRLGRGRVTGGERPYLVGLNLDRPPGRGRRRRHGRPAPAPACSPRARTCEVRRSPEVTPAVEGMATAGELRVDRADLPRRRPRRRLVRHRVHRRAAGQRRRRRRGGARAGSSASAPTTPGAAPPSPRPSRVTTGSTVGVLAGGRPRRSAAVRTALVEALQSGSVCRRRRARHARASRWSAAAPATRT